MFLFFGILEVQGPTLRSIVKITFTLMFLGLVAMKKFSSLHGILTSPGSCVSAFPLLLKNKKTYCTLQASLPLYDYFCTQDTNCKEKQLPQPWSNAAQPPPLKRVPRSTQGSAWTQAHAANPKTTPHCHRPPFYQQAKKKKPATHFSPPAKSSYPPHAPPATTLSLLILTVPHHHSPASTPTPALRTTSKRLTGFSKRHQAAGHPS